MTLADLENELYHKEKFVERKKIERDILKKQIEDCKNELDGLTKKKNNIGSAIIFLKKIAAEARNASCEKISILTTETLKPIYGDDYIFSLTFNEEALEQGDKSGFSITPKIGSTIGDNQLVTSIQNSRGGGLLETISVNLRFSSIEVIGYNGPIVLDETWASVSADQKMEKLIEFLEQYKDLSDKQIIFITHRAEMFGKIADNILLVQKKDGMADVSQIDYNDVLIGLQNDKES